MAKLGILHLSILTLVPFLIIALAQSQAAFGQSSDMTTSMTQGSIALTAVHDFVAVKSGNWDNSATWGGVTPPMVIDSGETVLIPSGISVSVFNGIANSGKITVNGSLLIGYTLNNQENGTMENNGNIEIYIGTMSNSGSIENHGGFQVTIGALYNYGHIHNTGSFTSGVFEASGMINSGTIVNDGNFAFTHSGNNGIIINNENFSIGGIGGVNNGMLNNTGTLIVATNLQNNGIINNKDGAVLQNNSVINNNGSIINFCGAQLVNSGQILGNPVEQKSCLEVLKDEINNLKQDGKINSGEANSLAVKLENVTCNRLQAFVNEVNAMTNAGKLNDEESSLLKSMAQELQKTTDCIS